MIQYSENDSGSREILVIIQTYVKEIVGSAE